MESCSTHKVVERNWSSFVLSLSGSALKVCGGGDIYISGYVLTYMGMYTYFFQNLGMLKVCIFLKRYVKLSK